MPLFEYADIENKELGSSVRTKLNLLGAQAVTNQEQVDTIDGDLSNEIATRVAQVSTLTTNLNAEIARAIGVEALKADLVGGKVPTSQLPSYVDAVVTYANAGAFPAIGDPSIIYVANDTLISYRWVGSGYAPVGSGLALGETSGTAYRGDRGKIAYDHSQIVSGNPHGTTLTMLGAGNSATRDVGVTAGTVAAGNDSRITGALQSSSNLADVASAATAWTNIGGKAAGKFDTVPIANGGTGATSASAARTALGLGSAALSAVGDFLATANNFSDVPNKGLALTTLGFTGVINSGNGWIKIPMVLGGVLRYATLQWMKVSVNADSSAVFSWPIPFGAVCSGAMASHAFSFNTSQDAGASAYNENVNNVTVRNGCGQTSILNVWGIGY